MSPLLRWAAWSSWPAPCPCPTKTRRASCASRRRRGSRISPGSPSTGRVARGCSPRRARWCRSAPSSASPSNRGARPLGLGHGPLPGHREAAPAGRARGGGLIRSGRPVRLGGGLLGRRSRRAPEGSRAGLQGPGPGEAEQRPVGHREPRLGDVHVPPADHEVMPGEHGLRLMQHDEGGGPRGADAGVDVGLVAVVQETVGEQPPPRGLPQRLGELWMLRDGALVGLPADPKQRRGFVGLPWPCRSRPRRAPISPKASPSPRMSTSISLPLVSGSPTSTAPSVMTYMPSAGCPATTTACPALTCTAMASPAR